MKQDEGAHTEQAAEHPKETTSGHGASGAGAAASVEVDTRTSRELVEAGRAAQDPREAMRLFERAHRKDLNDPFAMSFHGMALATVMGHYQQGIVFCEEAVRRLGPNPDLLVNLAKAYLVARNRREAVRALRRAMARAGGAHERARVELASLGLRRPPVIGFLPRSFFLNRILGRLRHELLSGGERADDGVQPIPAELGQLSGDVDSARRAFAGGGAKNTAPGASGR